MTGHRLRARYYPDPDPVGHPFSRLAHNNGHETPGFRSAAPVWQGAASFMRGCAPDPTRTLRGAPASPTPHPRGAHVRARAVTPVSQSRDAGRYGMPRPETYGSASYMSCT
jgi:hypothetical protein